MRKGYIIRDRGRNAWFARRFKQDGQGEAPVTVYVRQPELAWEFRSLRDAKRIQRMLRAESRQPGAIKIIDPRWRVVC